MADVTPQSHRLGYTVLMPAAHVVLRTLRLLRKAWGLRDDLHIMKDLGGDGIRRTAAWINGTAPSTPLAAQNR